MTDIVERLRAKADRLKFVEQFDEESLSKPVLLRDRQNLWEAADEIEQLRSCKEAMLEGSEIIIELKQEIERLRAKEKDWTEVFEAQKSIIGRLRFLSYLLDIGAAIRAANVGDSPMGYTHYWTIKRQLSEKAWAAIVRDAREVLAATTIPLAAEFDRPDEKPLDGPGFIQFNGIGNDGHETFMLSPHKTGFEFCKTAQKPYDTVVTALLIIAAKHAGKAIEVTSDGDCCDWLPGLNFVRQVLGSDYAIPMPADGTVEDTAGAVMSAAKPRGYVIPEPEFIVGCGQFRAGFGAVVSDWQNTKEAARREYYRLATEYYARSNGQ